MIIGSILLVSGCTGSSQQPTLPSATTNTVSVPSYMVSVTIERGSSGDILITNMGGTGAKYLSKVEISFVDKTGVTIGPDTCSNLTSRGVSGSLDSAGSSATIAPFITASPSRVIVTGTFKDNTAQVLSVADV